MAIFRGTPNRDVFDGTPENDLAFGKGGDDVLNGAGGSDRLEGGADDDTLLAGRLAETTSNQLLGQAGDDISERSRRRRPAGRGSENDSLHGFGGDNRLFGRGGDDKLNANELFTPPSLGRTSSTAVAATTSSMPVPAPIPSSAGQMPTRSGSPRSSATAYPRTTAASEPATATGSWISRAARATSSTSRASSRR